MVGIDAWLAGGWPLTQRRGYPFVYTYLKLGCSQAPATTRKEPRCTQGSSAPLYALPVPEPTLGPPCFVPGCSTLLTTYTVPSRWSCSDEVLVDCTQSLEGSNSHAFSFKCAGSQWAQAVASSRAPVSTLPIQITKQPQSERRISASTAFHSGTHSS